MLICHSFYYLFIDMNSKAKIDPTHIEVDKSDISMHSEGYPQGNCPPDKFFSFSQSFANIEQADRAFHERSNSMSRIKALQEEVKSFKSRSALWQKARAQILELNRFLKLSAITLGCGDSTLLKQFFEKMIEILEAREVKNKDDRNKVAESKKKQADLFEKLVETNKKKYELQQKLVQFQQEITKLNDINESLRERSRVQSTDRSSKFHEETMMTLHHKDSVLYSLEQRNSELKLDIARLEEAVQTLNNRLDSKEHDLAELRDTNEEIQLQLAASNLEIKRLKENEQESQSTFASIKVQIADIIQENGSLRRQLSSLKAVIEETKILNDSFINETQSLLLDSQSNRQARINELLKQEQQLLKKRFSNNIKFATSMRRKPKKTTQKIPSEMFLLPSQQLLI